MQFYALFWRISGFKKRKKYNPSECRKLENYKRPFEQILTQCEYYKGWFWGTPVCFGQQTTCPIYLILYLGEHPFVLGSKVHAQYTYYYILGNTRLFWTENYMHNILITISWGTPVCFGQQTTCTIYLLLYFVLAQQPPVGNGLLIQEVPRPHTTTHHSR